MPKYRYARSNGQFLESKFVNPVADATSQNFRIDQSYDLNKNFVSGNNPAVNSFVTGSEKLKGYEVNQGNLLAWWRLGNKDDASTSKVEDSSGNNIELTQSTVSQRPTLDSGDRPSKFISNNSFLFDGADDELGATGTSLVFGNGTADESFSVSTWIKINSLSDTQSVLGTRDTSNNSLWFIRILTNGTLQIILNDQDAGGYRGRAVSNALSTKIDVWTHVTFTYDGRSGTGANSGISIYIDGDLQTSTNTGAGTYTAMDSTETASIVVGNDIPLSSWEFMGNIAEIAIWNNVLSAENVSNLYGAKIAGAYHLVRDYSQESIDNDTKIIGVQAERKGLQTADLPADMMNQYRQGTNIVSHGQLVDYLAWKIRSNSSFTNTLRGKDLPKTTFNEELATTSFRTGQYATATAKLASTSWSEGQFLEITDGRGSKIRISPAPWLPTGTAKKYGSDWYNIGISGSPTITSITKGLHDVIQLAQNDAEYPIYIDSSYNSITQTTELKQLIVGTQGNVNITGNAVADSMWTVSGFSGGSAGASTSYIVLGGEGKLSSRLSHEIERRDLGQHSIFDNSEPFEDTLDLSPIAIITTRPENLILPYQMVSQTSNEIYDGVIEPLTIRAKIDRSTIDSPFIAHDVRGHAGPGDDAFRRSFFIVDGKDLDEPGRGTAPFLDSVETFGSTDMPGAFSDDFATIAPYVDYLNDLDKEYTTNGVSSTIATVMIISSSFDDDDIRTYDKMSPAGFTFDNCPIGIDSIAYGGLKK